MQAYGRLVKDKNGSLLRSAHLACQLQPLRLSARKPRRLLAQRQIAKAQLFKNLQPLTDGFHIPAKADCRVHIRIHKLRKRNACAVLVCKLYIVSGLCIAGAAAVGARNIHIRQELHIKAHNSRAIAAGAAKGAGIIGKIARLAALFPCIGGFCIQLAQLVVNARIGGHRGTDIYAYGGCVYQLDMRDALGANITDMRGKRSACNAGFQRGHKAFQHHCGFAGARYPRYNGQPPFGDIDFKGLYGMYL